jgi:hypothetical protein
MIVLAILYSAILDVIIQHTLPKGKRFAPCSL